MPPTDPIAQALPDIGLARLLARMQHVPAIYILGVATQFGIAGDTPDVGGDIVPLLQDLLSLQDLVHDGPAAEEIGLQPGLLLLRGAEPVHPPQDPFLDILTGRYAPEGLIDVADLVTEMKEIKHYYTKDIPARDGIER